MKTHKFPSDKVLFGEDYSWEDLNESLRQANQDEQARRRNRLRLELAHFTKRMITERWALEDFVTEQGIQELSSSLYAFDWKLMYEAAVERENQGYWKRLWNAFFGRSA